MKTTYEELENGKTMIIRRTFDPAVDKVWDAWTKDELLDQWWAPQPWKVKTKSFDFAEGGEWLYAMKGPEGQEQ